MYWNTILFLKTLRHEKTRDDSFLRVFRNDILNDSKGIRVYHGHIASISDNNQTFEQTNVTTTLSTCSHFWIATILADFEEPLEIVTH